MAVSSSPIAPLYPPVCYVSPERMDLLKKKPGIFQFGAMKSPVFPTLQVATRLPVNAAPKAVSTEKENVENTVLVADAHVVKLHRQNGECMVLRGDVRQGFRELEGSEKKDLIFTCAAVCHIYESKLLGTSISPMAPLVTDKVYILKNPANQPEGLYITSVNPDVIVPTQIKYLDFDIVKILLNPIDGKELSITTLLAKLNTVGGNQGIGLIDMDENQLNGMMSHGVYNTSGGTIMWHAVREFKSPTLPRETMQQLKFKLANLVHSGILSDPLREAIMNMITEKTVGSVEIKFYRGSVTVAQGTSP